jgi:hypothetical protein
MALRSKTWQPLPMQQAALALYDLGFNPVRLKPGSKVPIEPFNTSNTSEPANKLHRFFAAKQFGNSVRRNKRLKLFLFGF